MAGLWTKNLQGVQRASAIGFAEQGYATIINRNGQPITTQKATGSASPSSGFVGTYLSQLYVSASSTYPGGYAGRTFYGIIFGSGNTAPSVDDVDLVATVEPTINSVVRGDFQYSNGVASRTMQITIQNPNALPMTIAEWGLIGLAASNNTSYYSSITSSNKAEHALLYRAVLDVPVTLQQFETATFTLTLQMTIAAES